MFDITATRVQHTYDAVRACLKAFTDFKAVCERIHVLVPRNQQTCDEVAPDEDVNALSDALKTLREKAAIAREAVDAIMALADGASGEILAYRNSYAPSLAEIVVMACEIDSAEEPWQSNPDLSNKEHVLRLRQVVMGYPVIGKEDRPNTYQPEHLDAALRIECSIVRERALRFRHEPRLEEKGLWRIEGSRVVFEGPLETLTGRSRDILAYLVVRRGRPVTHHDLGTDVWETEFFRNDTINQAMSQLRKELRERGLPKLAEALKATPSGFLLPTVLPSEDDTSE